MINTSKLVMMWDFFMFVENLTLNWTEKTKKNNSGRKCGASQSWKGITSRYPCFSLAPENWIADCTYFSFISIFVQKCWQSEKNSDSVRLSSNIVLHVAPLQVLHHTGVAYCALFLEKVLERLGLVGGHYFWGPVTSLLRHNVIVLSNTTLHDRTWFETSDVWTSILSSYVM